MRNIRRGVVIGLACVLVGVVGCGDDDGAAGSGGTAGGGSGGSGGNRDSAVPMPAMLVGNACSASSDCDGPHPECLDAIDPAAPFAALTPLLQGFLPDLALPMGGTDMDGGLSATIATPGGYCTSTDCSTDAQCGDGAICYSIGSLLASFSAGQGGGAGGGIDIGGVLAGFLPEGGGYCLDACVDDSDCSRAGYECRPLLDASAFAGAAGDGGFALPFDAGGVALPDGGFSLPDGGAGVADGGLALPTYCLPELAGDGDGGTTVE